MVPLFRVYAVVGSLHTPFGTGEVLIRAFASEEAAESYRTEVERAHREHRSCGMNALKIDPIDVIGTAAEGLALDERADLK
jgi:hypothetical protein